MTLTLLSVPTFVMMYVLTKALTASMRWALAPGAAHRAYLPPALSRHGPEPFLGFSGPRTPPRFRHPNIPPRQVIRVLEVTVRNRSGYKQEKVLGLLRCLAPQSRSAVLPRCAR